MQFDEMGYKPLGMVRRGKRGLGLHCLFLTWLQHQAHPRKTPRPSFSAPLEDLALPVGGCGSQPRDVPGPGIPAPLLRGVWELSGKLLFQLGGKTNSPQNCLLDGGKKGASCPSSQPHHALLGCGRGYLEHRLRLGALLGHVHTGPAIPLVVSDALGQLCGLQPLETVALGAAPLIDVL